MAALEGAKYGLCFSSGLGALTALASTMSAGDHIICDDDLYGGTHRLLNQVISRFGIEVTHIDLTDISNIEKSIKPNTKVGREK